ncbi:MAG: glycosyltransferase family 4 protein [Planctomycetes bacterium]|nr:glycosyltransferase family 4 protein [Planctomycetota bacterium]
MNPATAASTIRIGLDYRPALLGSAGIARSVRELARALDAEASIEPRLFGHSLARCRRGDPPPAGLRRLPIPGRSLGLLQHLGLGADRLCGGVDVFHWTDFVYPPLSRAPAIVTIHDLSFAVDASFHGDAQSRVLLDRCRRAATSAVAIICPTRASANDVVTHLGIDDARIEVIPFGVDHVTRGPRPEHPRGGRPFVLALGTIEPRKNHARLIAAWRALPDPRPELVVIGNPGWESSATLAELERAAHRGELTWLRNASDACVHAHLSHASVLAYPSLLEGFGFPPLEAMALGTPVLAGDTPALREVCDTAVAYCDPTDVESIRHQLARILETPPDADRRVERAARFTWEACAGRHAELYRRVSA